MVAHQFLETCCMVSPKFGNRWLRILKASVVEELLKYLYKYYKKNTNYTNFLLA